MIEPADIDAANELRRKAMTYEEIINDITRLQNKQKGDEQQC